MHDVKINDADGSLEEIDKSSVKEEDAYNDEAEEHDGEKRKRKSKQNRHSKGERNIVCYRIEYRFKISNVFLFIVAVVSSIEFISGKKILLDIQLRKNGFCIQNISFYKLIIIARYELLCKNK